MHSKAYQTKLLQRPTSFGQPGTERSRKTGKNTGSVEPLSLLLPQPRVHLVCPLPTSESSDRFHLPFRSCTSAPVKPSILQCSWTTSEQNHFFNSCLIDELRSWNQWTRTIQYCKQKTFWCWTILKDLLSLLWNPGDYLDTIFQYLLVRCFVHS